MTCLPRIGPGIVSDQGSKKGDANSQRKLPTSENHWQANGSRYSPQSASPSAIGVKALKPFSVLVLNHFFGQENPAPKTYKMITKEWFVSGLKSLFLNMRSSIG